MTRVELTEKIRQLQSQYAQVEAKVDGSLLCGVLLSYLQLLWQAEDSAELSLADASIQSGYSEDHLRRLARGGRLPHARRGRRLFFQAGKLPKKPRDVDASKVEGYDPLADARQVAAQSLVRGSAFVANFYSSLILKALPGLILTASISVASWNLCRGK